MKNYQKGFTLIELLVVIAIIGILSSIVLASLSSARSKGEDAAIQSTLSNMRAQAELLYSNTGDYGKTYAQSGCSDTADAASIFGTSTAGSLKNLVKDLNSKAANQTSCTASTTAWAAAAKLKSAGAICVDYTGVIRASTTATTATSTIVAGTGTCL